MSHTFGSSIKSLYGMAKYFFSWKKFSSCYFRIHTRGINTLTLFLFYIITEIKLYKMFILSFAQKLEFQSNPKQDTAKNKEVIT